MYTEQHDMRKWIIYTFLGVSSVKMRNIQGNEYDNQFYKVLTMETLQKRQREKSPLKNKEELVPEEKFQTWSQENWAQAQIAMWSQANHSTSMSLSFLTYEKENWFWEVTTKVPSNSNIVLPLGKKWSRTKESLGEGERGEWKSCLKTQHSEN